jgi:nucleoid-associated protein YgaU
VSTPTAATAQGPVKALLRIIVPDSDKQDIPLRFNPTEYQLQKGNTFAEIGIPGLQSPPLQFIRGAAEKLSVDVLVDTSDTLDDVRVKYTNRLRGLMDINGKLHAPPIVKFLWGTQEFVGVMESLTITFQLFTQQGVPIRAKLAIVLKEYRPAALPKKSSPDVEKAYTVRRGDTLSSIAGNLYKDPGLWRKLAEANDISDPRSVEVGRTLTVPRLT